MGRRLSENIGLAALAAVADGVQLVEYAVRRPSDLLKYGFIDLESLDAEGRRLRASRALARLERSGFVERIINAKEAGFRLTSWGEFQLDIKFNPPPALPKGMWTVVSFDIPEKHKAARQGFRAFLRCRNFRRLQFSVWISDLDWASRLDSELKGVDIGHWIKIFKAESVR